VADGRISSEELTSSSGKDSLSQPSLYLIGKGLAVPAKLREIKKGIYFA
jgi:hypothetical protein